MSVIPAEATATAPARTRSTGEGLARVDLPVRGMTCSACATRLEKALGLVPGVGSAAVNFAVERADVAYDPATLAGPAIADATVKEKLAAVGITVHGGTPEELGQFVQSELTKWAKVTKDANIVIEQ